MEGGHFMPPVKLYLYNSVIMELHIYAIQLLEYYVVIFYFFLKGFWQERPIMDINEDGNVAFSKRRSETVDFWAGLMKSTLCADDQIKIAP